MTIITVDNVISIFYKVIKLIWFAKKYNDLKEIKYIMI